MSIAAKSAAIEQKNGRKQAWPDRDRHARDFCMTLLDIEKASGLIRKGYPRLRPRSSVGSGRGERALVFQRYDLKDFDKTRN